MIKRLLALPGRLAVATTLLPPFITYLGYGTVASSVACLPAYLRHLKKRLRRIDPISVDPLITSVPLTKPAQRNPADLAQAVCLSLLTTSGGRELYAQERVSIMSLTIVKSHIWIVMCKYEYGAPHDRYVSVFVARVVLAHRKALLSILFQDQHVAHPSTFDEAISVYDNTCALEAHTPLLKILQPRPVLWLDLPTART